MTTQIVALGGRSSTRLMQVTGEQQVGSAVTQATDCHGGAANQCARLTAVRQVEWMVGDQNPQLLAPHRAKYLGHAFDLLPIDSTSLEHQRARGVDADDCYLVVDVCGFRLTRHDALVPPQRREETCHYVVERHVVISRHDYRGNSKALQERLRLGEFTLACALCQVARDGDEVRRQLPG